MSTDPSAQRSVFALDNVRLELPIAAGGSRSVAAVIDYTLLLLVFMIAFMAGIITATLMADSLPSAGWIAAGVALATFAIDFSFFFLQELLLGGQTLGKKVLRLRVVSNRGGRATPLAFLLRNLVRTIDLLFGTWFLVLDPRARRIGDRIAGTMVVHEPLPTSSMNAVRRAPAGWGPDRIAVVETLLQRSETLPPERMNELATQVLAAAEKSDPSFATFPSGSAATDLMRAFGEPSPQPTSTSGPT